MSWSSFFIDHMSMWFLLFIIGLTISSVSGVNPLTMSNEACKNVVAGNARKVISNTSIIFAVIGEYAFLVGAIIIGVNLL